MNSPFFSIILPTYNRAAFLPAALESVLGQQFEDWELVIVDDGSVDDSQEVVASYRDNRIRYFFIPHRGRSAARNEGFRQARGRYICFLDSDDLFLDNHLLSFYTAIHDANLHAGVFITSGYLQRGGKRWALDPAKKDGPILATIWRTGLSPIFICVEKEVFRKISFDESVDYAEDYEFILRALLQFPCFPVPGNSCIQMEHPQRTTSSTSLERLREMLKMKQEVQSRLLQEYTELEAILSPAFLQRQQAHDQLFFAHKAIRAGHLEWSRRLYWRALNTSTASSLIPNYCRTGALLAWNYLLQFVGVQKGLNK